MYKGLLKKGPFIIDELAYTRLFLL